MADVTRAAQGAIQSATRASEAMSKVPIAGLLADAKELDSIRKDLAGDNRWRGVRRGAVKISKMVATYVPFPYNLIFFGFVGAVVMTLIAMSAAFFVTTGAMLQVTGVTDRYGDGTWACGETESGFCNETNTDPEFTADELKEFRREMDEGDEDIKKCLYDAPPVTSPAGTLYIASAEEKQSVADYQKGLRDKWRSEVDEYAQYAREQAKQGRRVPPIKVEDVRLGDTPPGVDRKNAYRVARRDQQRIPNAPKNLPEGTSDSALIDPDLISVHAPVVSSGNQIMRPGGRSVPQVNRIANGIPVGTNVPTATAFLYAAYAGGVVNWSQFEKVVNAQSYRYITEETAPVVASSFFKGEVDFAPYQKAVASSLISLYGEERIVGDIEPAMAVFEDC